MTRTDPHLNSLPTLTDSGPRNMAGDELLMDLVAGEPWLRFYQWTEPTLSLGYFQPFAVRNSHAASAGLPVVRRTTGGGAIVHHRELTYAIAVPDEPEFRGAIPWPCRFHKIIAIALSRFGVFAECGGTDAGAGEFLCFRHHSPGDVTVNGRKVVGSAQRRRAGVILQHGSILLMGSQHAPELPGVADLTGRQIGSGELTEAILNRLCEETGWRLKPQPFPPDWRERVTRRVQEKFGTDEWNRKR